MPGEVIGRRRLLLATALVMAGCAAPPRTLDRTTGDAYWSGRLALQVDDAPSQSFSATFELRGSAERGELALYSPLGSTVAQLRWQPGGAWLTSGGQAQRYESMDDLTAAATGTALPLPALFEWLAGRDADVPGWQADLSRLADGRLVARRSMPLPRAELRLVFDAETKAPA
jgi:outer membrane lipoprotein LolB